MVVTGEADQYLVEYSGTLTNLEAAVRPLAGKIDNSLAAINVAIVSGISEVQAAALRAAKQVSCVTRDVTMALHRDDPAHSLLDDVTFSSFASSHNTDPTNAVWFDRQWNLKQIQAEQAWAVSTGEGVRVGILDSGGSPDHQDLVGKYDLVKSRNFITSDPSDWQDRHGHGTWVAGIVTTNNIFMAGVAPSATLVAVKVGGRFSVPLASVLAGIVYAADPNGGDCDVINLSLVFLFVEPKDMRHRAVFNKAINWARGQGCLVVAATGNNGLNFDRRPLGYGNLTILPVEAGGTMGTGGTAPFRQQNFDQIAPYSNHGVSLTDVVSPSGRRWRSWEGQVFPGDAIVAPMAPYVARQRNLPNPMGRYSAGTGTSGAAPHLSGVAALVEAAKKNSKPSFLQTRIQQTADDLGKPGVDIFYGKGRINAANAVR